MKSFLSTFAVCFILLCAFLFFGGYYILTNFWATAAPVSLIAAVIVALFEHQESKIDELEQRLRALETDSPDDTLET